MIVRTFKRIGTHHLNNCDDSVGEYTIGERRSLILVADGCSMGEESHFASELFNKSIRSIAKAEYFLEFASGHSKSLSCLLRDVMQALQDKLIKTKAQLGLEIPDLLTTLVLAIVDAQTKEYVSITLGDGLIVVDDRVYDFDQENKPDYFAYHLDEEFEDWFEAQKTIMSGPASKYVSLATDGIYTFADRMDKRIEDEEVQKLLYQLLMNEDSGGPNDLQNKVDRISQDLGLQPTDDLAIARAIYR